MSSITADEMAAADENSEYLGVRRLQLMENAGRAVAEHIKDWMMLLEGKNLAVVCGTGNNGGDGFVAARHLAGEGAKLDVFLLGVPDKIGTEEASVNWKALTQMHQSITLYTLNEKDFMDRMMRIVPACDVIVDAIFGTGVRGPIHEPWRSVIRAINDSGRHVIAVDIPSGLDPTTGEVQDLSVRANSTVTFHKVKPGLLKRPDLTGSVLVKPIGIPEEAELIMGPGDLRLAVRDFNTCRGGSGALTITMFSHDRRKVDIITKLVESLSISVRLLAPNSSSVTDASQQPSSEPETFFLNLGGKDSPASHLIEEILGNPSRRVLLTGSSEALSTTRSRWEENRGVSLVLNEFSLERLFGLSISAKRDLTEKMDELKATCRPLGKTIFVGSDIDLASDGERSKANWRGIPFVGDENRNWVFEALSAAFVCCGISPLRATSASSFIARGGASRLESVELGIEPGDAVSLLRGYGLRI